MRVPALHAPDRCGGAEVGTMGMRVRDLMDK